MRPEELKEFKRIFKTFCHEIFKGKYDEKHTEDYIDFICCDIPYKDGKIEVEMRYNKKTGSLEKSARIHIDYPIDMD